ncbi:hypothetical protein A2U01_0098325, partial [Trifolium medium]|nr:hypothetical protein [Trifolium medium]
MPLVPVKMELRIILFLRNTLRTHNHVVILVLPGSTMDYAFPPSRGD